ncbi:MULTISPECIES: HVO_2922 family protein [unclassified Haladaptatus]|uniref:HVO_2922 family protein n=1 Tax=unclassified Haladaptatus TaxID=2622732 RepID=UPI0023E84E2A|nr:MULTISPECIES: HVO_2922 family protein [unclassified Haladaptatus]
MQKATFELYRDAEDDYRWRLVHANGNILADSGEGYASKQKARQGIESVKKNAQSAPVEDHS